jgi:hypothetical protein
MASESAPGISTVLQPIAEVFQPSAEKIGAHGPLTFSQENIDGRRFFVEERAEHDGIRWLIYRTDRRPALFLPSDIVHMRSTIIEVEGDYINVRCGDRRRRYSSTHWSPISEAVFLEEVAPRLVLAPHSR